ncbi:MAG TPA: TIGR04282 family arsenosugar biosynthesis glycosyltransferase [Dissulfurispiraceae bacterium]|nr:TIGR04282 family arsenosugar biosynthesis glycosyltransferase [Dissulfurispiraceae bacterium]
MEADCLIVFVKWPERGKVKTRLSAEIGEDITRELYKCFVEDAIDIANKSSCELLIAYWPDEAEERVVAWLGKKKKYLLQTGRDLGEKMKNAFERAFENGCLRAVLIGSDFPDLPVSIIEEAFSALDSKPAVIGPAKDGGYYLIGFKKDHLMNGIFEGISWGSPDVFEKTMSVFEREGVDVHLLPSWWDIDRLEDLAGFIVRNSSKPSLQSRTLTYIRNKQIISVIKQ